MENLIAESSPTKVGGLKPGGLHDENECMNYDNLTEQEKFNFDFGITEYCEKYKVNSNIDYNNY